MIQQQQQQQQLLQTAQIQQQQQQMQSHSYPRQPIVSQRVLNGWLQQNNKYPNQQNSNHNPQQQQAQNNMPIINKRIKTIKKPSLIARAGRNLVEERKNSINFVNTEQQLNQSPVFGTLNGNGAKGLSMGNKKNANQNSASRIGNTSTNNTAFSSNNQSHCDGRLSVNQNENNPSQNKNNNYNNSHPKRSINQNHALRSDATVQMNNPSTPSSHSYPSPCNLCGGQNGCNNLCGLSIQGSQIQNGNNSNTSNSNQFNIFSQNCYTNELQKMRFQASALNILNQPQQQRVIQKPANQQNNNIFSNNQANQNNTNVNNNKNKKIPTQNQANRIQYGIKNYEDTNIDNILLNQLLQGQPSNENNLPFEEILSINGKNLEINNQSINLNNNLQNTQQNKQQQPTNNSQQLPAQNRIQRNRKAGPQIENNQIPHKNSIHQTQKKPRNLHSARIKLQNSNRPIEKTNDNNINQQNAFCDLQIIGVNTESNNVQNQQPLSNNTISLSECQDSQRVQQQYNSQNSKNKENQRRNSNLQPNLYNPQSNNNNQIRNSNNIYAGRKDSFQNNMNNQINQNRRRQNELQKNQTRQNQQQIFYNRLNQPPQSSQTSLNTQNYYHPPSSQQNNSNTSSIYNNTNNNMNNNINTQSVQNLQNEYLNQSNLSHMEMVNNEYFNNIPNYSSFYHNPQQSNQISNNTSQQYIQQSYNQEDNMGDQIYDQNYYGDNDVEEEYKQGNENYNYMNVRTESNRFSNESNPFIRSYSSQIGLSNYNGQQQNNTNSNHVNNNQQRFPQINTRPNHNSNQGISRQINEINSRNNNNNNNMYLDFPQEVAPHLNLCFFHPLFQTYQQSQASSNNNSNQFSQRPSQQMQHHPQRQHLRRISRSNANRLHHQHRNITQNQDYQLEYPPFNIGNDGQMNEEYNIEDQFNNEEQQQFENTPDFQNSYFNNDDQYDNQEEEDEDDEGVDYYTNENGHNHRTQSQFLYDQEGTDEQQSDYFDRSFVDFDDNNHNEDEDESEDELDDAEEDDEDEEEEKQNYSVYAYDLNENQYMLSGQQDGRNMIYYDLQDGESDDYNQILSDYNNQTNYEQIDNLPSEQSDQNQDDDNQSQYNNNINITFSINSHHSPELTFNVNEINIDLDNQLIENSSQISFPNPRFFNQFARNLMRDLFNRNEFINLFSGDLQFEEDQMQFQQEQNNQVPGMEETEINKMKVTFHTESKTQKTCAICLSDFEIGEQVKELNCEHRFHISCVDDWLKIKGSCPLCRENLTQNQPQEQEEQQFENELNYSVQV